MKLVLVFLCLETWLNYAVEWTFKWELIENLLRSLKLIIKCTLSFIITVIIYDMPRSLIQVFN
jgi:hypothetical protein